jgi:hypothetical protein
MARMNDRLPVPSGHHYRPGDHAGGPDVERDAGVAEAPAEQLPAAVFGDEPGLPRQ